MHRQVIYKTTAFKILRTVAVIYTISEKKDTKNVSPTSPCEVRNGEP